MKQKIKSIVKGTPLLGPLAITTTATLRSVSFPGSQKHWERKYVNGGTSGPGSRGKLAEFKAQIVNSFVREHNVRSVIDFGCGDGFQLSLATYPTYIGLDVSSTAIRMCKERFKYDPTKSFFLYDPDNFGFGHSRFKADLALSMDVIFHLVEDKIFELYMRHLFSAAERYVVIYSSDTLGLSASPHIKHRKFSEWIKTHHSEWRLLRKIPNKHTYEGDPQTGSWADFFIYEKG